MPKTARTSKTDRPGMVRWYQPLLLLRTGIRALLATVIGQLADNRELQAVDQRPQDNRWDFSSNDELWIDFVADLGDGWEASHAVACALARPEIDIDGQRLPRADLLLLGGDLVYPGPSIQAYEHRTFSPYNEACRLADPFTASVFAVPGNHDWYDGLHAFQDMFCHDSMSDPDWPFGCWQKPQTHSYFAWQLPHRWWLLAPDVQLDGRLNPSQRAYFRSLCEAMQPSDRVVIIAPYPHWAQIDPNANGDVARWLISLCDRQGADVRLLLTGDLHHYTRFSAERGESSGGSNSEQTSMQLVTAGGGGAFLHPTHSVADRVQLRGLSSVDLPATEPDNENGRSFSCQQRWPPAKTSRRMALRNLLFPITNWELSLFVGFVYTMLAWVLETRLLVGDATVSTLFEDMLINHGGVGETFNRMLGMLPKSPEFALVVLLTAAGLTAFNENCRGSTRLLLGGLHTTLHLVGLILTYCVAVEFTGWLYMEFAALSFSFFWFLLMMIIIGGGVGGVVIGVYLTLSLNLFSANLTNAFSSLRIQSWRNFLRLQITADGELHVHALGIETPAGTASVVQRIDEELRL